MKKFNLYLWLIALVGMITSCSQDETAGLQTDESNRVTLGAAVNQGIQTRAASVTIPSGYKLRYVLEVWSTGDNAACIYKYEKTADNAQAVEFTFNLTTAGDYKALLWADYVTSTDDGTTVNATEALNEYTHYTDVHYTTTSNLKNISLAKTGTSYMINDDSRDAFFKCVNINKGVGAFEESVELTRPFGQINVIERTTDLLAKVASMTLTYKVPQTFNVADGTVGTTVEVKPTVSTLPTATAARKANLFYDFVFAPATGQTTMESIAMTFTSSDNTLLIEDFSIPANMPVKRNKRTNISGSIIRTSTAPSDGAKLSVSVSDSWSGETEPIDINWDGTYPANAAEAKQWLGEEVEGASDTDGKNHVFEIYTAKQLCALHILMNETMDNASTNEKYPNACYKLMADIDLNNSPWNPIGTTLSGGVTNFKGTFDGQGHTISGLNVSADTWSYAGLFGCLREGVIKHLMVKGSVQSTRNTSLGGISGRNYDGIIAFCSFEGTVTGGGGESSTQTSYVGGICGENSNESSKIISCFANTTPTVTGTSGGNGAGGITGIIKFATTSAGGTVQGCTWYYNSSANPAGIQACYKNWNSANDTSNNNASYSDASSDLSGRLTNMNGYNSDYNYKWEVSGSTLKLVPKAQ